jgi:16S rRNA processing protein RimM
MGDKNTTPINGYEDKSSGSTGDNRVKDDLITIGYILKPHGIRGDLKVKPTNPDLDEFVPYEKVFISSKDGTCNLYTPLEYKKHKANLIVKFKEITDRNKAEKMRDSLLQVKETELPELEEDTYYQFQLIGLSVFNQKGDEIGVLEEILYTDGVDILVIENGSGKETLIPATT